MGFLCRIIARPGRREAPVFKLATGLSFQKTPGGHQKRPFSSLGARRVMRWPEALRSLSVDIFARRTRPGEWWQKPEAGQGNPRAQLAVPSSSGGPAVVTGTSAPLWRGFFLRPEGLVLDDVAEQTRATRTLRPTPEADTRS